MLKHLTAKLAAIAMLGLALGGCAQLEELKTRVDQAATVVSSSVNTAVSPTNVIIASNAFDAMQVIATKYLRLPRCSGTSGPICRSPAATPPLIAAVKAGRKARDAAQDYVRNNPNGMVPGDLYQALTGTVKTIQSIFDTYQVEAAAK